MTTPIDNMMPYGVTFIPNVVWGSDYMEVHDSAGSVKNTASSIKVPTGVFILQIASSMVGDTSLQITYLGDTPFRRTTIFTDGGRYMETLAGENIDFIRVGNSATVVNKAAGMRATVQITPIPNPI